MRMVDIIARKRHGLALSGEEIRFFVKGYTGDEIPDYQASALAMAICFAGMSTEETAALTMEMAASGEMADLSDIPGVKVDKHSTGGVGDKTTLIVGPIVAACGVPVAKMSGRGLGHTGGTIDKLESIPGYRTSLTRPEFTDCVKRTGISIAGQSGNLAPADKKLYALRDVTATVDSIPLIAASVMSKKIAAGADAIVLDVKVGSGAFLKTPEEARELAACMVRIGEKVGRSTIALITDMDVPLGQTVGNALEVVEAIRTLRMEGPHDLTELCLELSATMLHLAHRGAPEDCRRMAEAALREGRALIKFRELVAAQGGDPRYADDVGLFPRAAVCEEIRASCDGFIAHMNAQEIGTASMLLGAGRETKDDRIDPAAGLELICRTGDRVTAGSVIARLHASDRQKITRAREVFDGAYSVGPEKPPPKPLIHARIRMEKDTVREDYYAGTESKN